MKINEKKRLKNIRRRIFYRLKTYAGVKRHQKTPRNIKKHDQKTPKGVS